MNPYFLARSLLFQLSPEMAHTLTVTMMKAGLRGPMATIMRKRVPDSPVKVMGLQFPNRIGLAAGMDKDAECVDAWAAMGFGFIEAGTVTPKPQDGNPKPRLFRIPQEEAIINRMGFNNKGIDSLVERVKNKPRRAILGINIGKNKLTPNEQAVDDYRIGLRKAYIHADYIAINISSPNTPGLRDLQSAEELSRLLDALKNEQQSLSTQYQRYVPLALKIAPDIDTQMMDTIAESCLEYKVDALIVSNTTISRPLNTTTTTAQETGGLSGRPLMSLSTQVLKEMHARVGNSIPLIGSGGIMSADDALAKFKAGAALIQIYSGIIYRGPGLIRQIAKALAQP